MRSLAIRAACLAAFTIGTGTASAEVLRIGVLSDMSGPQADFAGPGSVLAARMAVADFGGTVAGMPVEVLSADHQNKADVGANIARQWIDADGVDAIFDVPNSAVALAVSGLVAQKNRALVVSGAGTSDLTGKNCTTNTVHWTYDTWAQANTVGNAVTKSGGDTWFFMTVDYAFGHALERDATEAIKQAGGRVVGTVRHPLGTSDLSSFLLQAEASRAKVIGLGSAGVDTVNAVKQAGEFGITERGQKLVAMLMVLNDIKALGLLAAQKLLLSEAFYWDLNDGTRDFAKRFASGFGGRYPNMVHAGVYASVLHYLKAVERTKSSKDGAAVVAAMKDIPTSDPVFGQGSVRKDGRVIHDMYLFEVKAPGESNGPYDLYKTLATVKADKAFRSMEAGQCPIVGQRAD
ncbi:ABC transporter substrate-binding protein [Methylobacterium sp. P1-11]|uniref:ABC transporter substrate-binding protein n=1 Tax=Methylobacterium sp. P1-11 TaxID=2024616 RepID=UPI0011ED0F4C|nr:ABC transporter substrate-binding protein [Methylobacterium sp. P1-11]KAA0113528.1 ABC transporter substrate-binding protein [Methylobacterium sp. P1-11]